MVARSDCAECRPSVRGGGEYLEEGCTGDMSLQHNSGIKR
jgi:hypothetical protein